MNNNKEILEKLEKNETAINDIEPSLLLNKSFVLSIINSNYQGSIYKALPQNLQADKEVYIACLKRRKCFIVEPSPILLTDRELMLLTLRYINVFPNIKEIYKNDIELNRFAVKTYSNNYAQVEEEMRGKLLYFPEVRKEIFKNTRNYQFLPIEEKANRDVISHFLKLDKSNIKYLPEELSHNKEYMMDLLKCFPNVSLSFLPSIYSADIEIIKILLNKDGNILNYLSDELFNNQELLYKAFERSFEPDNKKLESLTTENKNDKKLALRLIGRKSNSYKYISECLQEDLEVGLRVLKKNRAKYNILVKSLQSNWEIIYYAFKGIAFNSIEDLPIPLENKQELKEQNVSIENAMKYAKSKYLYDKLEYNLDDIKLENKRYKV